MYVRKKDGTLGPCVDYRRLNEVTEKDAYPLHVTSDCLDCLNGAVYMSSLDLQSGIGKLLWMKKIEQKQLLPQDMDCMNIG